MIAVSRGEEPEALKKVRNRALARAILARRRKETIDFTKDEFGGYEIAKGTLAKRLGYRCVFCEKGLREEGSPVEHFRPKAKVANKGEPEDPNRYWWLAWSWGNLLFACFRCNTDFKRNQFPLRSGTRPTPELCFEVSQEQALLIDPSRIDPRAHIRFKWSETRRRWLPYAVDGSDLGRETIEKLGLDEDDAADRYFETHIQTWVATITDAAASGAPGSVIGTWRNMRRALFSDCSEFQALSWDVLEHHFPAGWRKEYGVELPVLGCLGPVALDVAFHDPLEMSHLPDELRLKIRALGGRAPEVETSSLLAEVLALREWTDEDLARLFDREVPTVRLWRRALIARSGPQ